MRRRQLDLYAECNVEPRAPLDVFTAECCSRCVNPECTRSNFSNSKFESRVSNWYERLFRNVPTMAPDDERFRQIAGQRFLLIDPVGTALPSQGWVDPRELRTTSIQVPARIAPPAVTRESQLPVVEGTTDEPEAVTLTSRAAASAELALVNTPVTQGQMIGGKPAKPASEWRMPALTSDDKVVKTGAKIRIGS